MDKFLKGIEKAVTKAITSIDGSLTKTNDKIVDLKVQLNAAERDRTLFEKFLDKLDRILSILKE